MSNFVLIYTGSTMPETEDQKDEMMGAWGAWFEKMGTAVVDGGAPLGNAKNVTENGVGDGSVSSPPVSGYNVISADSLDAAVGMVKDHPHLRYGGQVTVHETIQM